MNLKTVFVVFESMDLSSSGSGGTAASIIGVFLDKQKAETTKNDLNNQERLHKRNKYPSWCYVEEHEVQE